MAKNNNKLKRRLIWGGVGLVVVWLVALSLRPKPEPADVTIVERGSLRVTIDEEGETRVRERYMVSAPVAGRVLRIELESGDPVIADETVLASFQPSAPVPLDARSHAEAEARVRSAQAALGRARAERQRIAAELRFAEAEGQRFRRLATAEIVSQETLESAELKVETNQDAVRSAEFAVKNAESDLEVARARLLQDDVGGSATRKPILIRAPVAGVVLRRLRESEAIVPAGEPLIEVANPDELEIVSDLLSTDAVKIRRGQRVLIEQWGGDRPLDGVVRRVEPYGFTKISALGVEEQRVNVVIDFDDPREAWEALGDGYRVEVRVIVWESDDVIKVPTSALFRRGDQWAVFVLADGKAAERQVEIGERNGLEAEVKSG
ncbi:MAG: HlyD family efflux transporter periplasmic adaptor subunit, partial [Thermoanaerobaculia bacterium]